MLVEQELHSKIEAVSTNDPFVEGLNRRPPLNNAFAGKDYRKGFATSIVRDFEGLQFNPYDVPWDQDSYDTFLSGLAGAREPRVGHEFRFHEERSHMENSYILGITLLLYHAGVPIKRINAKGGFPIQLRLHQDNLGKYQEDAYGTRK